jgi:16S rRNA (uracil1498-N3)-methyltransferase
MYNKSDIFGNGTNTDDAPSSSVRLFVDAPLSEGAMVEPTPAQTHYLLNVMRLHGGDSIRVFNGHDGEWLAELSVMRRSHCQLSIESKIRPQTDGPDILYLFAPLKKARLDYMVQKATEMGVAGLWPVITRRTIAERVNMERMRANAIEAAEQCGILRLPELHEPEKLSNILASWPAGRTLVFADEDAPITSPVEALQRQPEGPIALLIGPEGGFDEEERATLRAHPSVCPISLGPRVMRADTAAVAGLALLNAIRGDWRSSLFDRCYP